MTSALFVLNDGPYGSERPFMALRHAQAVAGKEGAQVKVFLTADATACALAGQSPPQGYYSIEQLLRELIGEQVEVGL